MKSLCDTIYGQERENKQRVNYNTDTFLEMRYFVANMITKTTAY